jgi:hypothetical protein
MLDHVQDEPMIRVVRGTPTPEELAALVVTLLGRGSPRPAPPAPASRWRRSGLPDGGPRPGTGNWRASALPR